jgi:hypothetical protein
MQRQGASAAMQQQGAGAALLTTRYQAMWQSHLHMHLPALQAGYLVVRHVQAPDVLR